MDAEEQIRRWGIAVAVAAFLMFALVVSTAVTFIRGRDRASATLLGGVALVFGWCIYLLAQA